MSNYLGPQWQILQMLQIRKRVTTSEILREVKVTTPAKCILRLRAQGYPIQNVSPAGEEAVYCYMDGGQMEMFNP